MASVVKAYDNFHRVRLLRNRMIPDRKLIKEFHEFCFDNFGPVRYITYGSLVSSSQAINPGQTSTGKLKRIKRPFQSKGWVYDIKTPCNVINRWCHGSSDKDQHHFWFAYQDDLAAFLLAVGNDLTTKIDYAEGPRAQFTDMYLLRTFNSQGRPIINNTYHNQWQNWCEENIGNHSWIENGYMYIGDRNNKNPACVIHQGLFGHIWFREEADLTAFILQLPNHTKTIIDNPDRTCTVLNTAIIG